MWNENCHQDAIKRNVKPKFPQQTPFSTVISGVWYRAVCDRPQGLLRVLIMLIMTDFTALRGGTGAVSAGHGRCYSDVEKTFIFGPLFGTKQWITLERKNTSKIANNILEKRQRRGSVPNFKTRALAVWKLKGKENCENEHRETASFMYNFVQKTNATVQLWWHLIPTSPLNFFTRFLPEDPF